MEKTKSRIAIQFLISTFLLSYLCWGIIIVAQQFGFMKYGEPLMMVFFLVAGLSPTIIAYIVLCKSGVVTFKSFTKEVFAIKQKPMFYLLIPLFSVLFFGIQFIFGDITIGTPWYISIAIIPLMMIGGGFEELGWRYILQPYFEKKMPFEVATCITSIIWALWHLPLFYIIGTSQQKNMVFGLFVIFVFGISFALAAIYRISKSIWLCILYHAVINAFMESFVSSWGAKSIICTSGAMIITAICIVRLRDDKIV